MKKNKQSNARKNKRANKNAARQVRREKNLNIRKKKEHDKEVQEQLNYSEEFMQKVTDFLMTYGERLDKDGPESLGAHSEDIIKTLDSINSDIKEFDEEHQKLVAEAEEFFNEKGGNEFSWLPTTVDLVNRIDDLRNRYTELYVLNHQTLLTYDH